MSIRTYRTLGLAVAMAGALALAGCANYVTKDTFQSTVQKLQRKDHQLQQQIDALAQTMKSKFAMYNAKITALQGRISINAVSYFPFNKATLGSKDKARLDLFAKIMRSHHSNALVTVEGFADPAGSAAYNKQLGMQRAQAVASYLVNQGGLNPDRVRAVSYGESRNRQVKPGATRQAGTVNRRVALAIDFAGWNTVPGQTH